MKILRIDSPVMPIWMEHRLCGTQTVLSREICKACDRGSLLHSKECWGDRISRRRDPVETESCCRQVPSWRRSLAPLSIGRLKWPPGPQWRGDHGLMGMLTFDFHMFSQILVWNIQSMYSICMYILYNILIYIYMLYYIYTYILIYILF